MNTSVTSKEAILETCRQLVAEKGLSYLNMRAVAKACGVALGSLYYYFPSKNDLVIAAIESVWEDIFRLTDDKEDYRSFPEYVAVCFRHIQSGIRRYPNFFTIHSLSVSTAGHTKARNSMERYLAQIREKMQSSLQKDRRVKRAIFTSKFREEDIVDFVLTNIVSLLIQKRESCDILLEVICRTIY